MDAFVVWLEATRLSRVIVGSTWIWPLCEILHFVGLSLVIGIAGFFDLRLMGFMKRVPVAAARDLMPLAIAGFLVNLTTGATFFIGKPDQYVNNVAWWAKMGFLLLAGLNAMFFETTVGARTIDLGAGADTPRAAKIVGALSLISWLGVLYWGRMLPFIGNAF
ncbi:MAG TPA: hypothetical protein VNG89_17660 [Vicinamibacterales bacterium]|nr:hypothetical protein [Vicinamibacterales bacterium]